jgi:glycosyltransferase involved in cell wall biosynthesis
MKEPGGPPIRVFVAHHQPWPGASGDAVHVWAVVSGLAKRGFHVITQGDAGPPGVEIVPFGRSETLKAVRRADVVYIRVDGGLNREKTTAFAWLSRRRPAVVWEVNAPLDEQIPQGLDPKRLRRWRLARRALARGCDSAVTVADELVGYVRRELGIADVTVVENGADLPADEATGTFVSPLRAQPGFVALWMGSATYPWQAADTVAAAARGLSESDPAVTVAMIGELPRAVEPEPPNLVLLGRASREEAAAHLRAGGVALCLYHDTPWAPDGFYMSPIKLFEAWSAGVPVIATDLASIRRIVRDGENAVLVPDDAAAVATAITRVRTDAALRARLIEGGLRAVRDHYNWDRTADEVAAVIRRAADARRASARR